VPVYEQEEVRRNLVVAIGYCENDMLVKWAKGWMEAVGEGRVPKKSLGA
jgi:hypothetical protein